MQKTTSDDSARSAGSGATAGAGSWRSRMRMRLPRGRFLATVLIALIGPAAAAAIGAYIYLAGGRYVSTDNAYVKADKIVVSSEVAGRVAEVMVKADQTVTRGSVLFKLDPEPYKLALDKAEAELDQTKARVEALRAEYREAQSELKEAEDRVHFYEAQRDRQKRLADKGVGRAFVFEEADSNLDAARARVNAASQKMSRVLAQLSGDPGIATDHHPMVRERIAARDRARIDLDHTTVRAPAAGIVTNFDLQAGEYLGAGSVAFSLVGTEEIWVQANFKETDLTWVEEGQRAAVHVDTYPDAPWTGTVTSISPATGAEFAILPPQNATGNWVKVVQRLPVRLKLTAPPGARPLRAGMSVVVEIDTGHKRPLPGWAASLLGRARASQ
ncbi:MAG: HlyD family secretion protein [Hyphomicrobiaceae bacterium]|nr:HlyD family secretion protein [Hyphomicrobiaceae bacterium]